MQTPKLKCDQSVCVFGPQWMGTIWPRPLPLTRVPDSLVCEEARHRLVKPLHTWPHGCNLARSVRGQITDSGKPYPAWPWMALYLYFLYERAMLQYANIPSPSGKVSAFMAPKYYFLIRLSELIFQVGLNFVLKSFFQSLDQEEAAFAVLAHFQRVVTMVPLWSCLMTVFFFSQKKGTKLIYWNCYHHQAESIIKFCLIQKSFLCLKKV